MRNRNYAARRINRLRGKRWFVPAGKIEIGMVVVSVSPKGEVDFSAVRNIARGTSEVIYVIPRIKVKS